MRAQPLKLRLALTITLTITDTEGAVLTLRIIKPSDYRAATVNPQTNTYKQTHNVPILLYIDQIEVIKCAEELTHRRLGLVRLQAAGRTSAVDRSWQRSDRDPDDEDGDGGGGGWRSSRRTPGSRHRTRHHLQPLRHRSRDLYDDSVAKAAYTPDTCIATIQVLSSFLLADTSRYNLYPATCIWCKRGLMSHPYTFIPVKFIRTAAESCDHLHGQLNFITFTKTHGELNDSDSFDGQPTVIEGHA